MDLRDNHPLYFPSQLVLFDPQQIEIQDTYISIHIIITTQYR